MTREEENEWINNLTDEERDRLANEGCGSDALNLLVGAIGLAIMIVVIGYLVFLDIFGEYDMWGHFVKWKWE